MSLLLRKGGRRLGDAGGGHSSCVYAFRFLFCANESRAGAGVSFDLVGVCAVPRVSCGFRLYLGHVWVQRVDAGFAPFHFSRQYVGLPVLNEC